MRCWSAVTASRGVLSAPVSGVLVGRRFRVGGRAGWRGVAVVVAAVCVLAPVLAAPAVGAQAASESGPSVQDVELRDNLIADQEALLNVYRCMFDTDTHVVPGGCANSAPAHDAQTPHPFAGDPTAAEVELRDRLVADQEALLNVYRCLFDVDTEVVPGGCADTAQAPESDENSAVSLNIRYGPAEASYHCAANSENRIECSIDGVQVDSPSEPLTDLFAHAYETSGFEGYIAVFVCGKRSDQTLSCWTWDSQSDDEGNRPWHLIELDTPVGPFTGADFATFGVGRASRDDFPSRTVFCGWRSDQTLDCWAWDKWSWNLVDVDEPAGPFTDIRGQIPISNVPSLDHPPYGFGCGWRADQPIDCWYWNWYVVAGETVWSLVDVDVPDTSFDNVSYGDDMFCGWKDDQPIDCWTWNWDWYRAAGEAVWSLVELDVPDASFDNVFHGGDVFCGLRAGQPIYCWTWNRIYDREAVERPWNLVELDVPDASFGNVVYTDYELCGLRAGQPINCWTWDRDYDREIGETIWTLLELDVPDASFDNASSADNVFCGLRAGQPIDCWSWNLDYDSEAGEGIWSLVELDVPDASFDNVSSANSVFCGLRAGQTAGTRTCWSYSWEWYDDLNEGLLALEFVDF